MVNASADPFEVMALLGPRRFMAQLLAAHQAEDAFEPQLDEPLAVDEDGC